MARTDDYLRTLDVRMQPLCILEGCKLQKLDRSFLFYKRLQKGKNSPMRNNRWKNSDVYIYINNKIGIEFTFAGI